MPAGLPTPMFIRFVRIDALAFDQVIAQSERFLYELRDIYPDRDFPIFVVWLAYASPSEEMMTRLLATAEELDIQVVEAFKALNVSGKKPRELQAYRFNKHPNKAGHSRVASELARAMVAKGVLPDTLTLENDKPEG